MLIKVLKRRVSTPPSGLPPETAPLLTPAAAAVRREVHAKFQDRGSASFDMALARVSIAIETTSYVVICLKPTSVTFTVLGIINAFASGLVPAMRSVALELYHRTGGTESGRLFGGLSMINALWYSPSFVRLRSTFHAGFTRIS